jgi:small subunit ribosomal protein S6
VARDLVVRRRASIVQKETHEPEVRTRVRRFARRERRTDLRPAHAGRRDRHAPGGQLEKSENWGRRKLAYEIGRHKEGTYVLEVINGSGELMKELERRLKVLDYVIRHLVVRVDEHEAVVERTRSKRTEASRRRRVARGLPADRQPGEGQRGDSDDDRDDRFDMGVEL